MDEVLINTTASPINLKCGDRVFSVPPCPYVQFKTVKEEPGEETLPLFGIPFKVHDSYRISKDCRVKKEGRRYLNTLAMKHMVFLVSNKGCKALERAVDEGDIDLLVRLGINPENAENFSILEPVDPVEVDGKQYFTAWEVRGGDWFAIGDDEDDDEEDFEDEEDEEEEEEDDEEALREEARRRHRHRAQRNEETRKK